MENHTQDPLQINHMELPGEPPSEHQPSGGRRGFSKKKIAIVVAALIGLLGLGFGFAILSESGDDNVNNPQSPAVDSTQNTTPSQTIDDVPSVVGTKNFKADFPRIELTYPENWTVTANRDQEGVRVESPNFNYRSINGNTINGNFRIYIRQGARQSDSKYIGRGIASLPSEKLTYSNPPTGQRPETNLSFFGIDTNNHFAFFLIAGNFSLEKDESLGPEYGTEPETYIIAGGYTSSELTDDLATNPVPLEYFGQTNAYKQAIEIIKSLKLL